MSELISDERVSELRERATRHPDEMTKIFECLDIILIIDRLRIAERAADNARCSTPYTPHPLEMYLKAAEAELRAEGVIA